VSKSTTENANNPAAKDFITIVPFQDLSSPTPVRSPLRKPTYDAQEPWPTTAAIMQLCISVTLRFLLQFLLAGTMAVAGALRNLGGERDRSDGQSI
jgi:hypothetical protein